MRLILSTLLSCLFWIYGSCALGQEAREVTLHGKGEVIEEQDVERMRVEGTAKGYITGTFIWEEEHQLSLEPGEAIEKGTVAITDQNGDKLILSFSGKANMRETEGAVLEGAKGSFTYLEGTGPWAKRNLSGTYTKAGVIRDGSIELSITLMAESS